MARTAKGSGSTPATVALAKAGIAYAAHAYEHDPAEHDFGGEAARELGVDAARVFKTLLAEVDGALVVAVVPVSGTLDLKALAAVRGGKRAQMAEAGVAEKRTGYVVGGISPIGQRTRLPTVIDESALGFETVFVSGGRRGLDLELAPADLARATAGAWAGIARR